ncbi:MAG: hypothetical protein AAGG11_19930 [Pseudomonadota bacterium]
MGGKPVPWLYWGAVALLALLVFFLILYAHAQRPAAGVLGFVEASFRPGSALEERRVGLPHDWRKDGTTAAEAEYRVDFTLSVAPQRLWAVYVPALEMTPAIAVNGVFIGGRQQLEEDQVRPRFWGRPVIFNVPAGLLKTGQNHVSVVLRVEPGWGRLSEIYLGPQERLQQHFDSRYFWRVTLLILTASVSLLIALFMMSLGIAQSDGTYRWFAAFAGCWFLHNLYYLFVDIPLQNPHWDAVIYIVIGLLTYTASVFSLRFLKLSRRQWELRMATVLWAGSLGIVVLAVLDDHLLLTGGAVLWTLVLLAFGTYPATLMLSHFARQRDWQTFSLAVCYALTLLTGAWDWSVLSGFGYRHNGMLMQFSAAPALLAFGSILMLRFNRALRESSELNRELEDRVATKVEAIESAFERNRQLQQEQVVAEERLRIMRDMHDGVGGHLIGMLNQFDSADPAQARWRAEAQAALNDLRLMIDSLDDIDQDLVVVLGLLRNRIQPQIDAAGVQLVWDVDDLPPIADLGPERVLHFMRILQETVTNCIKHANATRLVLRTRSELFIDGRRCIGVVITDNGTGFDPAARGGRGLQNMAHRAQVADLLLRWSTPKGGCGTQVAVGFPLSAG